VLRGGQRVPRVVPLGDAREIDALVAAWRRQAGMSGSTLPPTARRREEEYRAAAIRLRRAVWDPAARYLAGARRVFIVPDGALDLVNFATLPVEKAAYLVERGPLLHYLSTERDLAFAKSTPGQGGGLLAVGAPDFDARPDLTSAEGAMVEQASARVYRGQRASCDVFRATRFPSLPGSGAEVNEIASLWRAGATLRLVGAGATETAFKELAPGREVVHVATHGFFVGEGCPTTLDAVRGIGGTAPAAPVGSAAAGEGGESVGAGGDLLDRPRPESPLLLAGLAFAGANHRDDAPPDRDDGILTAEEIAAMDLSGVRWAVLSACETGVGEVRAGEGVLGLRRAFQVAGARTTIMSLWWVDDEATRDWMRALYEAHLMRGRDTAESVREAALDVLRERRSRGESTHPFTWGAFVASGDWR
jgi:CHAT domain-containing protein